MQCEPKEPVIRLDQFMKLVGLVRSGGQAKHVIQAGEVAVNDVTETRRSRKLRAGDRVSWRDWTVVVERDEDDTGEQ